MNKKYLSVIVSAFLMGSTLFAQEIETSGTGKTPIVGNLNQVKSKAKNEAIKKAVLNAINKALGSDASKQPNIIAKLDDIIEQIDQFKTDEELKTDSDGVEYIVKYNMKFDDQKFRKLLTDLGIAVNTNTVRSSAILVLMDEYFTTPTDMKAPLEEVTTYSKDKSQYYKEGASDKSFDNSSDSSKYKNDTSVAASASRSGSGSYSYGNGYGSGYASGSSSAKGSINATDKSAGESQSSRSSGSESSSYVDATSMDKEFFQKTVKYQPRSAGPEKQNATLAALYHVLGEYDINHLDNDIFKSKYFGNKPITLEQLTNSEELTKYAVAAYADQKADYFAIGSTIIVDKGRSATTGNYTCDGTIAMKVYATSGQSQVISAGALNESASGSTPDQCKGNIGKKLADEFGSVLSAQIQDYYKKRQMYGKEYIVRLIGTYSLGQRNQFIKALNTISGVKSSKQRGNNEYVVTFGGDDIQTALTGDDKLMNDLKIMDAKVQGNELLICQTMECK
jgi:hypothetical protein